MNNMKVVNVNNYFVRILLVYRFNLIKVSLIKFLPVSCIFFAQARYWLVETNVSKFIEMPLMYPFIQAMNH